MAFVLDTSVTIAWCYEDESTVEIDNLLQLLRREYAIVPLLWQFEVANVLWLGTRKGRIDDSAAHAFLNRLSSFDIVSEAVQIEAVLNLALDLGITAYDAS